MRLLVVLLLMCLSTAAHSKQIFELSQDPTDTVLYLSHGDGDSFSALQVQADGRATVTTKNGTAAASKSWDTWIDPQELKTIAHEAVTSGLADWDTEAIDRRIETQVRATAVAGTEAVAFFKFSFLRSDSGLCRPCERWVKFHHLDVAIKYFPQLPEFSGIQRLMAKLAEIAARSIRSPPNSLPVYEFPPEPDLEIIQFRSKGTPSGRSQALRVYGDGRAVVEEGFAQELEPRSRWESRLEPNVFSSLRQGLLNSGLASCGGSCLRAKVLRAREGRELLAEDGSSDTFNFAFRDAGTGELVRHLIKFDNTFLHARKLHVQELTALAALFAQANEIKLKTNRGEGK